MPKPSQEPPAFSKVPNPGLKDMNALCTFKIKIESKIWKMSVAKISDHIEVKLKMQNPS